MINCIKSEKKSRKSYSVLFLFVQREDNLELPIIPVNSSLRYLSLVRTMHIYFSYSYPRKFQPNMLQPDNMKIITDMKFSFDYMYIIQSF